jgi:hypothetical protein
MKISFKIISGNQLPFLFMRRLTLIVIFIQIACLLNEAEAIIIRHDVPDSQYVELGELYSEYLVHMNLELPGMPPDGEGVLIDPYWALTAAHVATEVETGHTVTVDGKNVQVDSVYIHPDWDDGASNDIALIKLREPMKLAKCAELYSLNDEAGQLVVVAGRGDTGNGNLGPTHNDSRLRAATNQVDGVTDLFIYWEFDDPEEEVRVQVLEGISGPGDSGGPAFLERGGRTYVAGISSSQSTSQTNGEPGMYGVVEYYVRVSSYLTWIYGIIG